MTSPALQEVVALLGCPAAGNPSQYLFERMIAAAGLDWQFVTFDVAAERIDAAVAGVAALGLRGCLLAGPLRATALPAMAAASPTATFAGAVGLAERRPDGLFGHMTDGRGVLESLRAHVDPTDLPVLVVGADAAGRATALELALARAGEILICDRVAERAEALVAALAGVAASPAATLPWEGPLPIPDRVRIVVSAVPASAKPPPVLAGLRPDLVVADLGLDCRPTPLVAAARAAGCCVIDGLEIHCARAAIDFHTLTGTDPDVEMVREALDEFMST